MTARISINSLAIVVKNVLITVRYKSVQLQGPICGSTSVTSSFIQYLVGLPIKVDVFLSAADSGFSNVFSLLEHLKV